MRYIQKIHENVASEEGYQITVDFENNKVTDDLLRQYVAHSPQLLRTPV